MKEHKLDYKIHSWSSHSACFHPNNILEDNPNEQSSRWSTANNNQTQFLIMELKQPSIVVNITFGKYHKVHVCNLKEFKVYGGVNPDDMTELLHSGLRNDNVAEKFSLRHQFQGVQFPIKYVKIVPLVAWGANFNFSIWYVELEGIDNLGFIEKAQDKFLQFKEQEAVKLCLKFLRQRNYTGAFNQLEQASGLKLEHEKLALMHSKIVKEGNYLEVEQIVRNLANEGVFQAYIDKCHYNPIWERIFASDPEGKSPSPRGGHQMCIDINDKKIYLLGGWDGQKDLGDFWCFDIEANSWQLLYNDTAFTGGPGARSCHKICFDPKLKRIFVLGKYVEPDIRANCNLFSDFYCYDIQDQKWIRISTNVAEEGGPELIYDHQMCISDNTMYVYGGRSVHPDPNEMFYSGLYSYDIANNRWTTLRKEGEEKIKGRIGHSMAFDQTLNQLYILAGQRNKDYYADFLVYDIDKDEFLEKQRDFSILGGPEAGFTQRVTMDEEKRELYLLSGLTKEKGSNKDSAKNVFWTYNLKLDKWTKVYQNLSTDSSYWEQNDLEPMPRFAHQLLYDPNTKIHYLFGGNPGDSNQTLRLDDFWMLSLAKPTLKEVVRKCVLQIRIQNYTELCQLKQYRQSVLYLRTSVYPMLDKQCMKEMKQYQLLSQALFGDCKLDVELERRKLYEELLVYFPDDMKQPTMNLVDLIKF